MGAVVARIVRAHVAACLLLLCVAGLVAGCGASSVVVSRQHRAQRSVRTVTTRAQTLTPTATTVVVTAKSTAPVRHAVATTTPSHEVSVPVVPLGERRASLAAARRAAAKALSAGRNAAAVRAARGALKRRSSVRVAVVEKSARAQQRAALARAKRVSALAVRADPGACLTGSGVSDASRAASRAKTTAARLRVRELVLKCLHESQLAGPALMHAGGGGRVG
jgi:hypothetical protein